MGALQQMNAKDFHTKSFLIVALHLIHSCMMVGVDENSDVSVGDFIFQCSVFESTHSSLPSIWLSHRGKSSAWKEVKNMREGGWVNKVDVSSNPRSANTDYDSTLNA